MSRLDIDKIVEMTNNKIGYDLFKKEERMRKYKMKKVFCIFMGVFILLIGTISVDALTDNSIGKAIDNFVNVTVNGKDNNANCTKNADGTLSCKIEGSESTFEITEAGKQYNYDIDIETSDGEESVKMNISDK